MRRIFVWVMSVVLLLLTGCSSTTQKQEVQKQTVGEAQTQISGPKLTYIGHAALQLTASDGRVILIDPSISSFEDYPKEADFILVTHGHEDHKPYYKLKVKENGVKITHKEALVNGEYQHWEYDGIVIEAVPAGGNEFHPIDCGVGYVVTMDGITVYHAGDSSNVEELHVIAEKEIDYAFYPIDGVANMDAKEATELANIIGATHNIPMHMNNDPGEDKSVNFTPEGRLVLKETETIALGE